MDGVAFSHGMERMVPPMDLQTSNSCDSRSGGLSFEREQNERGTLLWSHRAQLTPSLTTPSIPFSSQVTMCGRLTDSRVAGWLN